MVWRFIEGSPVAAMIDPGCETLDPLRGMMLGARANGQPGAHPELSHARLFGC
jgi:hypothetical protein